MAILRYFTGPAVALSVPLARQRESCSAKLVGLIETLRGVLFETDALAE